MRIFLLVLTIFAFTLNQSAFSQTKLIAHKSHSGTSQNFHKALTSSTFSLNASNFGQAPNPIVTTAKLDTLKFISDSVSVMVTSEYCTHRFEDTTTFWKAGADTLYNHPLFSKKHSLDSIKTTLKGSYYFKNSIDSVVFIGYDQPNSQIENQKQENRIIPLFSGNDNTPPLNLKLIVFSVVVLLSLFVGFIGKVIYGNRISFKKN